MLWECPGYYGVSSGVPGLSPLDAKLGQRILRTCHISPRGQIIQSSALVSQLGKLETISGHRAKLFSGLKRETLSQRLKGKSRGSLQRFF